jgi:hypothetical protein
MSARRSLLLTAAATVALVAGACTSSGGSLDDPVDILVAGMSAAEGADTVHVDVAFDGTAPLGAVPGDLDVFGQDMPSLPSPGTDGSSGGSIDLTGSTIAADLDRVGEEGVVTFSLPAFLSATGEVRIVGQVAYVQTSLFGDAWYRFDESDADGHGDASPGPSGSPGDPEAEVREALAGLSTPPERLADERCGDADCYHVRVVISPEDADDLASIAPDAGGGIADVWIRKSDELPAQVVLTATGEGADLKITMTFADWGKDVTVEVPPADKIRDGDELPFPMDELDLEEAGLTAG